ncbi:MAG: carbon storage regulator [Gemmataceae bacterium]|nr:carbon storage regulator [Gemmataceae bacterium]
MLVLTRRPDESVLFPQLGISVKVIRVSGSVVRVGVDAPSDLRVLRGELACETKPDAATLRIRRAIHSLVAAERSRSQGEVARSDAEVRSAIATLESDGIEPRFEDLLCTPGHN